jgi:DNA-binding SARP family transcriptional activator/DNA-binding XRE family transcriptional regulator
MEYEDRQSRLPFGALIRAHRQAAKLTQHQLAAKAGLSVAAVRDFEQQRRLRPRRSSLSALASALGLDPDQTADLVKAAARGRRRRDQETVRDGGPPQTASAEVPRPGLWVAALGPLEVWRDGKLVPLGPPKRRAILGLLLLNAGMVVRRDSIIDAVWGERPPGTAVSLVQAHVSRLRRALESDDRTTARRPVIESVRGAYRLRLTSAELDLLTFQELAAGAAEERARGDDLAACLLYEEAVALWRGDPLADVELLRRYPGIMLLQQQLADVTLGYANVASALGRSDQVVPRLRALAAAEPLNEAVHAQLMIALAGTGQQAAAIQVYEALRVRLDRELGLYPSEELADAHLRVLRQDIRTVSSPAHTPEAAAYVVPRQLPATPRYFAGRLDHLAALSALLDRDAGEANGIAIAALTGMAGVGKTALAVRWAHQAAELFPDGQLFIDLRGSSPAGDPVVPADALGGFLTALGVPAARVPEDTAGQAALYRSLLVGRRMLIVLDNAQDAEQVRSLLPGAPGCLVLVTSRNRLTGLAVAEGAQLLGIGVLTDGESYDLLNRLLGVRALAEPAAVAELIALCGGLPLALCAAAARAAARPSLPLAALAADMREAGQGLLGALETGESATSVRTVFMCSRRRISEPGQRMFRALGMHAGPDITVAAAASMVGVSHGEAYFALAELCNEHLVVEQPPGRYACHPLLHVFAAERALAGGSGAQRRAMVDRVLDHYLHTANAAAAALSPSYFDIVRCHPWPGVVPEEFRDGEQAARWLDSERPALLAAIGQAARDGRAPYAWKLPWIIGLSLPDKEYWPVLAAAQESAFALAVKLDDLPGQTVARAHLGLLKFSLGEYVCAWRHLDEAMELSAKCRDNWLATLVELARGRVMRRSDRPVNTRATADDCPQYRASLPELVRAQPPVGRRFRGATEGHLCEADAVLPGSARTRGFTDS